MNRYSNRFLPSEEYSTHSVTTWKSDYDFIQILGNQVAEGLDQLLLIRIGLLEVDGKQQFIIAFSYFGVDGGQRPVVVIVEPAVEQIATSVLFAVSAVAHHNHGVFDVMEETAQYINNRRRYTAIQRVRIRSLTFDAERVGVHQVGINATYRSEIQMIVDTIPVDKGIVEWIRLDNLIRV